SSSTTATTRSSAPVLCAVPSSVIWRIRFRRRSSWRSSRPATRSRSTSDRKAKVLSSACLHRARPEDRRSNSRPMGSIRERAAAAATAFAVCLLVVPATPLLAQDAAGGQASTPLVIETIHVRGQERLEHSVIVGESGLRVGSSITWKEVNRAIRRLWATGQFKDVRISAAEGSDPSRVRLTIEVEEQPYIASIEFN